MHASHDIILYICVLHHIRVHIFCETLDLQSGVGRRWQFGVITERIANLEQPNSKQRGEINQFSGIWPESGNFLLLKSADAKTIVWQSIDHPSDTLVSGQKFAVGSILKIRCWTKLALLFCRNISTQLGYKNAPTICHSLWISIILPDTWVPFQDPTKASAPIDTGLWRQYMQRSSTLGRLKRHDTWKWTNGITIFGPEDPDVAFQHAPSNNLINPNKTFPKYARLEPDGNLKTYVLLLLLMRSATSAGRSDSAIISSWELNFQDLLSLCEFPNACGPYGICSGAYSPT